MKYKYWDVYEVLPPGWKIDYTCGSPLHGFVFCTDGKSPLNGGKRALVKIIKNSLFYIWNSKTEESFDTNEMKFFPANWEPELSDSKFFLEDLINENPLMFENCKVIEIKQ